MENHSWYQCFLLSTIFTTLLAQSGDGMRALLADIYTTRGYNKKVLPLTDLSNSVTISVEYVLNSVIEFDEKTESLKTSGYLNTQWNDEYFTWDPDSFDLIKHLFLPQDDIWKPDISLLNSFKSFTGLGSSYLNAEINNLGHVLWKPYQVLESTCAMSITYFPFDVQTCELKFSAWSYTVADVTMEIMGQGIQLDEYVSNPLWDLVETSTDEQMSHFASTVIFQMKLKRRPRFYVITIIIPIILLSILNMFSFVIPVTSGERAGYSITVFLSLAVFLTIVSELLPHNSEHTSLLAVYIMVVTGLSTAIVMLCVVQLRILSWNDTEKPVNKFYQLFVRTDNVLHCRICCKNPITPIDEMSSTPTINDEKKELPTTNWLDVVNAMDFIFFLVTLVITLVCTIAIGAIAVNSQYAEYQTPVV